MARGGFREGSGRKPRSTPKQTPIYCGKGLTPAQRKAIIETLSPKERAEALLKAVKDKK